MSQGDLETIGRFRIERLLGSGGMGAVYLAEDPVLKRRVAVKVVQGSGSQQEGLARFRREAEVSARLNHPNVITIYDVGEDPKAGPFIAMEFVDGSSLGELVQQSALRGPVDRLRILIDAMRAVEAAHAAGIVHRDIKPGNLMIAKDGRVKLMDFGVARDEDSGLTMTGAVIGTPAYISPEQLKGSPPSAATDRYAFVVMAFETFTATKPFSGPTTVTLLYNIAHQPPTYPESLSPALRKVFERALAKNPDERYPDLPSFLAAMIRATVDDHVERERLLHEIGVDDDEPAQAASSLRPPAAGATVLVQPATISEGIGGRGLGMIGAGMAALVAVAAVGLYALRGQGTPHAPDPVVVAKATVPPLPPPAPEPSAGPMRAPAPQAALQPSQAPLAVATAAPVLAAAVDPTAEPAAPALPAVAPVALAAVERAPVAPTPTASDLRDAVSEALREEGMRHVEVRLTGKHDMLLANLRSAAEAERARALAARITDGELNIATALRDTPRPAPPRRLTRPAPGDEPAADQPPVWQIRPEGAERTD